MSYERKRIKDFAELDGGDFEPNVYVFNVVQYERNNIITLNEEELIEAIEFKARRKAERAFREQNYSSLGSLKTQIDITDSRTGKTRTVSE
ncbi:hypothetical protein NDN16_09465 [Aureimonas altamirensis]|uniref:hypothetical protein n=1 Tax=Aureimonas altamirensis TaxID=370622 RepID=UPI0020367BCC|nr:hypothetical protein [Aureimonas altamirensis]MCM2503900.1 hypothetical protein [Aureimonas altamirensis]